LHKNNLIQFYSKNRSLGVCININIKNLQTYSLIKTIQALQSKFIATNNKQDLVYISHKTILEYHKKYFDISLISSNISTIIYNTYYKDSLNNSMRLNYLVPKKYFILYLKIKNILNIDITLSDKQLCKDIKKI